MGMLQFLVVLAQLTQPYPLPPCAPTDPMPVGCTPQTGDFNASFIMIVSPTLPRYFTNQDLSRDLAALTRIECYGTLEKTKGAVRYFVDGTAPTATVGTVVPPITDPTWPSSLPLPSPSNTLDGPYRFFLYTPALVRGFKVIATYSEAEIRWNCQKGI